MRYKFRAYDEINEVMEYGVSVDNGRPVKEGYQLYNTGNTVYHSQLMQYTGLTDKNGKEIYEGDIVLADSEYGEKVRDIVCWSYGSFYVANHTFKQINNIEVISNIHQNKKLLKEKE